MQLIIHLLHMIRALVSDRNKLALENVALRHQIVVLKRTTKRARITDSDRAFRLLMKRILKDWEEALFMVRPETVVWWHREGFRAYWRHKFRSKPGRPPIRSEVIALINRSSRENPLWGSPRIEKELALLGHIVTKSPVEKYMVKAPKDASGTWRRFIQRHMDVTAACDFFVVPTLTFKQLYCFVVLAHDRRRILHINVTQHPTAEWAAQQIIEAFPDGGWIPRYLVRDMDAIYGEVFRRKLKVLGITDLPVGPRKPMMSAFCERVIGTIRRECTDHIIALGERHLLRTLHAFTDYYNEHHPHGSLSGNSPVPRRVDHGLGEIIASPVLGGLHHTYRRAT